MIKKKLTNKERAEFKEALNNAVKEITGKFPTVEEVDKGCEVTEKILLNDGVISNEELNALSPEIRKLTTDYAEWVRLNEAEKV